MNLWWMDDQKDLSISLRGGARPLISWFTIPHKILVVRCTCQLPYALYSHPNDLDLTNVVSLWQTFTEPWKISIFKWDNSLFRCFRWPFSIAKYGSVTNYQVLYRFWAPLSEVILRTRGSSKSCISRRRAQRMARASRASWSNWKRSCRSPRRSPSSPAKVPSGKLI